MKQVYLLRHAEKELGPHGALTEPGKQAAAAARQKLPQFKRVIASASERAQMTATLMTGQKPEVRPEAGFYLAPPEKSARLGDLVKRRGIPFSEAVNQLGDAEILGGVDAQARSLNQLIDELLHQLLHQLGPDEAALIVSHDMSITPAMAQRGLPFEPIAFLGGYIVSDDVAAARYTV